MNFIVEFYTITGTRRVNIQASTYHHVALIASQEVENRDGILSIRCIREIPVLQPH